MCESLVSFCHFMCIVTLLGSAACTVDSIKNFACKSFFHCFFIAGS